LRRSEAIETVSPAKHPATVAELYDLHETLGEKAKALYDQKDAVLKKLVRAWKKNKQARVGEGHVLEIEDSFRGATKAFAPGFAHRYKLKLKPAPEAQA
jgi:hypothetical protein